MTSELTGRRRFRVLDINAYSRVSSSERNVLVLQVEYSFFGKTLGKWSNEWRDANPEDITSAETVVGLPHRRG